MNIFTLTLYLLFTFISKTKLSEIHQYPNICNTVYTEKQFYLQSPKFPKNYPHNLTCDYILTNPETCKTYFKFDFINFNLENSLGCVKDRLVIHHQDALCGEGPKNPKGNIYFSNNGTLLVRFITDGDGTGSGFKILVTRIGCENDLDGTTTDVTETFETSTLQEEITTLPFHPFNLPIQPTFEENPSRCCLSNYNSRRFLITSPNFPNSLNTKQECVISIEKSNQNICRLRLTFLFFYLGSTNYNNCPYGYLKIDGKLICGCNQGLKLTTSFENENIKNLIFKTDAVNINSQTGFVIEVIQDECPTKYYPASEKFADKSFIEQAQLLHKQTKVSDYTPNIIKTFYFFAEPNLNTSPMEPRENEPTSFIDTSTISQIVTNFNIFECTNWNQIQLNALYNRYGRNLQTCKRNEDSIGRRRRDCIDLNYLNGYFRSPGYPFFYPKHLNTCYRFRKQTGFCGVRLFMNDFQIKNSYGCYKDYVLLENGSKYCGDRLFHQYITFDLSYRNHADLIFVSNRCFLGRGFYGTYKQLECESNADYPTVRPDFRTTTTIRPAPICDRYLSDQAFVLEVTQNSERCSFQIRKFSQNVCKINLYFEKFSLFCGSEALIVDNQKICGRMTGRKISVNFEDNNDLIQILYRSNLVNQYGDFKFRILGEQITDDCLFPVPPVQRFVLKS